jgi:hypothetical protein
MRRPDESHTDEVSSRNESDNPERLDRASSDPGHDVNETSSRCAVGKSGGGYFCTEMGVPKGSATKGTGTIAFAYRRPPPTCLGTATIDDGNTAIWMVWP